MKDFFSLRHLIENEFEEAKYNPDTGIDAPVLEEKMHAYINENKGSMSMPLLVANVYALVFNNAQIEINLNQKFGGKLNLGVDYSRVASHTIIGKWASYRYRELFMDVAPKERGDRLLAGRMGATVPDTDFWHTMPDWQEIIDHGFAGLLCRAKTSKAAKEADGSITEEEREFYDSVIIVYTAIINTVKRMRDEALRVGHTEYAEVLAALSERAPKTLYEAMELCFLYITFEESGVERCRMIGPTDKLFYPFYKKDLEEGRETDQSIRELFRFFYIRLHAAKRDADQPILIGGSDMHGNDLSTELSYLMMEVYADLDIHNPKIHVRCNKNMPKKLLYKLCDMIRKGNSSMTLVNDETIYRGYEKIGVPREVSQNFCTIGCYEPVIMGIEDARICGSWVNAAKAVEFAVHSGYDGMHITRWGLPTDPSPDTFEEFLYCFYSQLANIIEFTKRNIIDQRDYQYKINPSPILSGSIRSCMKKGKDVFNNGMEMLNDSIKIFAVGTAVDSLMIVKRFVYDEKRVTLPELSQILKKNWEGYEKLRLIALRDKNKWGNNLDEPDKLGVDIYKFAADRIVNAKNAVGGRFRLGTDSVAMAENYGRNTGATPDGRLKGELLSRNMRPVTGMEREGITAFLLSVTKADHSDFLDGAPLDFMLHPSAVEGEKGLDALVSIVELYFARGGFTIQGNVVNADTLKEAQKNPDKYKNLQVRVCGWNEYFVNMSLVRQNDFIARAEGIESC